MNHKFSVETQMSYLESINQKGIEKRIDPMDHQIPWNILESTNSDSQNLIKQTSRYQKVKCESKNWVGRTHRKWINFLFLEGIGIVTACHETGNRELKRSRWEIRRGWGKARREKWRVRVPRKLRNFFISRRTPPHSSRRKNQTFLLLRPLCQTCILYKNKKKLIMFNKKLKE